jgi:hypothetical protein
MLYDIVSQDVILMKNLGERKTSVSIHSLMQKPGGTYNLCEHRQSSAKCQGECTTSVSIDRLVEKSGGKYNLCEPSQAL